jgi:hypothetical protein
VRTYIRGLNFVRAKGWVREHPGIPGRPEAFEAITKETIMGAKLGWGLQVQSIAREGKVNLKNRKGGLVPK